MVEMAMINVQRAITPKVGKLELQFICSCLMVLYICVKFHENIQTVSELWSGHKYMVQMALFNVQKVITPSVS